MFLLSLKRHSLSCKIKFFCSHSVSGSCCHNPVPALEMRLSHTRMSWKTEMAHRVPVSPLPKLVLPLCWSISLHDGRCHVSHIQVSFLHWLWQGQTLKWWKFNESVKEVKAQHLHEQGPKVKPHGLVFGYRCCWVSFFGGGGGVTGQGDGTGCFKQPGAVGRNVLSFRFQSKAFFFFFYSWNLKIHLRKSLFLCLCILLSAQSHTKRHRAKGSSM